MEAKTQKQGLPYLGGLMELAIHTNPPRTILDLPIVSSSKTNMADPTQQI